MGSPASSPTMVVAGEGLRTKRVTPPAPFRRIAVCVDGSAMGDLLVCHAAATAEAFGVPLTVLRVLESGASGEVPPPDPLDWDVRQREALDWPLVAASVALKMKGASVGSASIVLGHVAPTPHVAADAASMLAGKTISESVAEEAGKAAVEVGSALRLAVDELRNGYERVRALM